VRSWAKGVVPIRFPLQYILLLFLCVTPGLTATAQLTGYTSNDPADFVGEYVSLIQLIASPLKYSGKKVRLIAYVTFRFEGEGLYLHKEDLDNGISQNAIRIVIPAGISQTQRVALDNKYVICEGTFVALKHGHNDDFANGTLVKITRIQAWR
jgi:hypothetical protein